MKLNNYTPSIEMIDDLESKFFSIADPGFIFDILRNKMYSNPMLAICREISCNARDAHREINTPNVPVVITLPNNIEPNYKIKDFGPGISPDRVEHVFIKYAASTKREDNIQVGAFGIGSKTPFSYSDTFTIQTNFNYIQYNYACFIDETKVGKLVLLSKEPTTEPNGTEIIIPVKPGDFRNFATFTEQATRHWNVKPIIKGGNFDYQTLNVIIEGDNWKLVSPNNGGWGHTAKAIIDGIEYPLDLTTIKNFADLKIIDASRCDFYLFFNTGELSLSASREQVYFDKPTQEKISKRLEDIVIELKKQISDKIETFPNLWDANIYYRKELQRAFNDLRIFGKLSWKGIALHNGHTDIGCQSFNFVKVSGYRNKNPDKIKRKSTRSLSFDENSALFLNDLPLKDVTYRHVKKAFENNTSLLSVQVVCASDQKVLDSLNKCFNLDKMEPKLLSSIAKVSGRAYTKSSSRLLVFKFDNYNCFKQVTHASLETDTNKKVLCFLAKDNSNLRQAQLKNNKTLPNQSIKILINKYPKTSFYGVDIGAPADRIKKEFGGFKSLDDFINSNILDNKTINYAEIKFAQTYSYMVSDKMLIHFKTFQKLINSNSLFLKRLSIFDKMNDIKLENFDLLALYESINGEINTKEIEKFIKSNPEYNMERIKFDYEKKYPLLHYINCYNYNEVTEHIAQYVNLVDKI